MALATASVEIVADTSRFERNLQQKLSKSGAAAGKSFNASFSKAMAKSQAKPQIGSGYAAAGQRAGQQFSKSFAKAAGKMSVNASGFGAGIVRMTTKQGDKAGKGFGASLLKGMVAPLSGLGKLLASAMDLGGGFGSKMGKGGGGSFALLGAAAVAAGAALGPLLGLVAAIPAAIAGAGAAVATLAVAFSGMGEAISAGLSGDMAKFQESLAGLAPPAQSVAQEIVGLKPAFDQLKASVQGAFFEPLVGQISALSGMVTGPLNAGMTNLSNALGQAAAAMVQFFASPQGGATLQALFDGIAVSVRAVTPGLVALTKGFLDMAAAGAASLGGIAPMMERIGVAMSNFAAGGGVGAWLGAAGAAASQLWQAISGLLPGLQAMAGPLGTIGAATRAALIPAFAAVGQTLVTLAPLFNQVFGVLGAVLNAVIPPAAALLTGLAQVIGALLGPAIAQLAPFLTQFVNTLGPVLTGAITTIMPAVIQLAGAIGNFLGGAIQALLPILQILAPAIIGALGVIAPIVQGMAEFVAGVINVLVGLLTLDFERMKTGAAQIWQGMTGHIMEILTGLKDWIVGVGSAIINGFINGMKQAWESGKNFVSGINNWIHEHKGPLPRDRRLLIPAGRALMSGLDRGIRTGFGDVARTVHGITNDLPGLAMPIHAQPMPLSGMPLGIDPAADRRTVTHNRTTTVSAPINVHTATADPARVARRTANRLAALTVA